MRVGPFISAQLRQKLEFLHRRTAESVIFGAECLLAGKTLTLTGLGRGGADERGAKHQIKRIDRLLGNSEVQGRSNEVCQAYVSGLLQKHKQAIVLVDVTELPESNSALTATLPMFAGAFTVPSGLLSFRRAQRRCRVLS